MPYVDSPHVRREQLQHEIAKDGTIEQVLLITTNLPINQVQEDFDQDEFTTFVDAVRDAMQRLHLDRAVIQGMATVS